jgi:hypothetical protein
VLQLRAHYPQKELERVPTRLTPSESVDPAIHGPAGQARGLSPVQIYILQGFVTKSLFSVRLDPFHWR